jgi:hypothetical protein
VFRERSTHGLVRDVVGLVDETGIAGEPLLVKVMENGRRTKPSEALQSCRARCKAEVEALEPHLLELTKTSPEYRVEVSSGLAKTVDTIRKKM